MTILAWIGFAVGVVTVLGTASSVMKTVLIPRAAPSTLTALFSRAVRGLFGALTARVTAYETRDRISAFAAPTFLITLLGWWLLLALAGFALLLWPFTGSLGAALRLAGSSMFTLGFDVPTGVAPVALTVLAAATGLVIVALQIAYLPVLYAAFNRRETLVTMLESLGGVPAWGPEVLARHELIDNLDQLPRLYDRWAEWAADISESHTTHRSLLYFRSPVPLRSWVLSLLAVLDAAALHLALNPISVPSEARPLLRVGYSAMRGLAATIGAPIDPDPKPDDPLALTRAEFDTAVAHLHRAGWQSERTAELAWPHFRGWRINYEAAAYALAAHLDAPPALWSGPRRHAGPARVPYRPVHREPGDASAVLREATARRRAARTSTDRAAGPTERHPPTEGPTGQRPP